MVIKMISRRNYFTITIVMFIVFFLFQFSNVALENWNHYEENAFVVDMSQMPNRSDVYSVNDSDFAGDLRETVIYIGEQDKPTAETVFLWAAYAKKNLEAYPSLADYEAAKKTEQAVQPSVIALDAAGVDWDRDNSCDLLEECIQSGSSLIFCNLPDVSVLKGNERLLALLGIQAIRAEEMTVEDLHLHDGFLLGGEAVYSEDSKEADVVFTFPWYEVSSKSRIYMNGVPKKKALGSEPIEEEALPAVIWQTAYETASVFVVNGNYMEDVAGVGILTAISAERKPYDLYPVVNAQNLIYVNYPGLADENGEVMIERYSQSLEGFYQNVIWPEVVAVRRESGTAISCMLAPQLDYEDDKNPDGKQFERYMKLLNEQDAETGLSGACFSDTPIEKKIARDHIFMQETLPDYLFTSFYADGLTEEEVENALQEDLLASVRTVVEDCSENKEVIGYLSEYVTRQSAVLDGFENFERYDFRVRCLRTALGYTSMMADLRHIVSAGQDSIEWVEASNTFRQNIQYYGLGEQEFADTTVSECDERIRSFLVLDYSETREFNSIQLTINDANRPVWFVLRTNKEAIESIEGGSWKALEKDAYLIEVEQEKAVIKLRSIY